MIGVQLGARAPQTCKGVHPVEPFQYVLILNPTEEEKKAGGAPKLLGDVRTIMAKDKDHAALLAGQSIPSGTDTARVEVRVRPFRG